MTIAEALDVYGWELDAEPPVLVNSVTAERRPIAATDSVLFDDDPDLYCESYIILQVHIADLSETPAGIAMVTPDMYFAADFAEWSESFIEGQLREHYGARMYMEDGSATADALSYAIREATRHAAEAQRLIKKCRAILGVAD
jgi:hypothetical protein